MALHQQDIFVNVVGGMKVTETATDLALAMAVYSSLTDMVLPRQLMVMGELGLNGEVRPVSQGQARLQAAVKHGITHVMAPSSNRLQVPKGVKLLQISHIKEAKGIMQALLGQALVVD